MTTPGPFSVRPAQPEDVDAVHRVHTEAIRAGAAEHYAPEVVEVWIDAFNPESFPRNLQRFEFHLAELTDPSAPFAIAAFVTLELETRELESLYVAPWGQGLGLGSHLLAFAEDIARGAGLERIWLDASLNAVSFYEEHGWRAVEEHARIRKGIAIAVVKMEKDLTP